MKRADRGCALLVFAKEPRSGAVKTRLVPFVTEGEAAAVYAAFLEDAASQFVVVASDVGCDIRYHVIGDHSVPVPMPRMAIRLAQEGDDLGSRMSTAFADAFTAGYGRVVIVGTDHPTLPSASIVRAFSELEAPSRVVIGPSDDGGYYLLGMNAFYPALFEGMTYSHPDVFSDTMERARATVQSAAQDVVTLPRWYDVDTPDTLIRLWGEINGSPRIAPATHAVLSRLATRYEWSIR